jgi:hypothetical protein
MCGYKENTKRSSHLYILLMQLITLIDREFQNRATGRIFGPTGGWRKLQNRGFIFCNCHKILLRLTIKYRGLRWVGHVRDLENTRNGYKFYSGNLKIRSSKSVIKEH